MCEVSDIVLFRFFQPQSIGPIVTLETSASDWQNSLSLIYEREDSSTTPVVFASRYIRQVHGHGIASMVLKSMGREIQLGGTVSAVDSLHCRGMLFNSTLRVRKTDDPYSLRFKVCKPGLIEVVGMKSTSDNEYIARIGFQSDYDVLMSLSKSMSRTLGGGSEEKSREETSFLKINAKLSAANIIEISATKAQNDELAEIEVK